jgi:hypothetical protein
MKTFGSVEEAFEWWVKTLYPTMTPEMKRGKAVQAMQDYIYGKGISEKRMRQILLEYGHFEIETTVKYKP